MTWSMGMPNMPFICAGQDAANPVALCRPCSARPLNADDQGVALKSPARTVGILLVTTAAARARNLLLRTAW